MMDWGIIFLSKITLVSYLRIISSDGRSESLKALHFTSDLCLLKVSDLKLSSFIPDSCSFFLTKQNHVTSVAHVALGRPLQASRDKTK